MGFLNEQSLRMIVEAPRDMNDLASFSFSIPYLTSAVPVSQCGPLKKVVIAARFDVSVPVGWPEMQIMRRESNGIYKIVFTTNTTEPKPTGYLNLYEYDLEAARFHINPGDALDIAWHGNYDQIRFSLAYCNNATSSDIIPMVSIVTGDYNSETDLLTLNTLNCEYVTIAPPSSGITGTQAGTVTEANNTGLLVPTNINQIVESKAKLTTVSISVVISIVIVCSLLLVVIILLFVHWQKNRSSTEESDSGSEVQPTNAEEVIEVDINEAYSTNAIHTKSNIAYSTSAVDSTTPHDYDYVVL